MKSSSRMRHSVPLIQCWTLALTQISSTLSLPPIESHQTTTNTTSQSNHTFLHISTSNITTNPSLWPATPFRYPVLGSADLILLSYAPSDPPIETHEVQSDLVDIEDQIVLDKTGSSFLPRGIMFHSGRTRLLFLGEAGTSLRRAQARMVVQALGDLTGHYGPRQIEWAHVEMGGSVVAGLRLSFR